MSFIKHERYVCTSVICRYVIDMAINNDLQVQPYFLFIFYYGQESVLFGVV